MTVSRVHTLIYIFCAYLAQIPLVPDTRYYQSAIRRSERPERVLADAIIGHQNAELVSSADTDTGSPESLD